MTTYFAESHTYDFTTVHQGSNHVGVHGRPCQGCLQPLQPGARVHVFRPIYSRYLAYEVLCEACAAGRLPERLLTPQEAVMKEKEYRR